MSSWDLTIPGSVVIAFLVVACCILLLLLVKTCLAIFDCVSRSCTCVLDTVKPVYSFAYNLVPRYTPPYNPADYIAVNQFPRNSKDV
uniref:Envelope protein n=1 Tax=Bird deltacoronavirus HKU20 TaxID=3237953 RepID=A0AB39AGB2_9NIDO